MSCDILKINVDFNLFSMSNGGELLSILKFLPPLIIYLCESSQKTLSASVSQLHSQLLF